MAPVTTMGWLIELLCGVFGHKWGWAAPPPGSGHWRMLCLRCGKDMPA